MHVSVYASLNAKSFSASGKTTGQTGYFLAMYKVIVLTVPLFMV